MDREPAPRAGRLVMGRAARGAYAAAGALLRPALEVRARWRGAHDPEARARLGCAARDPRGAAWLHCSSVGELGGVRSFLDALAALRPDLSTRLTCQTHTGLSRARDSLGITAELAPYDVAFAIRARVRRTEPVALLLFETELWPALLAETAGRGLPVGWVNGRVTAAGYARWAPLAALLRPRLQCVQAFAVQGEGDARRFAALGAPPQRIRVVGNLKHDRPAPRRPARESLGLAEGKPVVVLGSLREGEEGAAVEALLELRRAHPAAQAVLAPRRPASARRLGALLSRAGIAFATRSHGAPAPGAPGSETLLLDTLGELASAYTLADGSFVGGSLVPCGGHDVMEAARAGSPVFFGPYTSHCEEDCESLLAAGAARRVKSGAALGAALADLIARREERQRMAAAALEAADRARGAARRALEWLDFLGALPPRDASVRGIPSS